MFQGRRAETEEKNRAWAIPPSHVSAVVLSHAHIDHSGRLPKLTKDGFHGRIYATPPTRDLCAVMLPDSAHIQEEDAVYVSRKRAAKGLPPIEALYTYRDVVDALELFRTISLNHWFAVAPGLRARFHEAGHMLGSAGIELEFSGGDSPVRRLYFTGDVGRPHTPILRDPAPFPQADYIICESTYGGRTHETVEQAEAVFEEAVLRTIRRGGKVIIPAFSVGRTQTMAYFLHRAMDAGRVPRVDVFIDSPLAVNASEVFRMHPDLFDREAGEFQKRIGDILGNGSFTYIRDVEDSKALHKRREPCVIISASGMCESGRIRHHIKNNISDPKCTLLFPGFQAENTLGRRLVDGAKKINLFNETRTVRAEIVQVHGFSGHMDQPGLIARLSPLAGTTREVFLVHGEHEQRAALAAALREVGFANVKEPVRGNRVKLE
jgi:metallo-beta-lactamase family protein